MLGEHLAAGWYDLYRDSREAFPGLRSVSRPSSDALSCPSVDGRPSSKPQLKWSGLDSGHGPAHCWTGRQAIRHSTCRRSFRLFASPEGVPSQADASDSAILRP